jgi:electron transport complex protein RnfG
VIGIAYRSTWIATMTLCGCTLLGSFVVTVIHDSTIGIIAASQRGMLEANLSTLLDPRYYDNHIIDTYIEVLAPEWLGTEQPVKIYLALKKGQPVALFATPIASDGYNGPIQILVGILTDGTISGVRVLDHKETPGFSDVIDEKKSNWIMGFTGRSIKNPSPDRWSLKKDGGAFDQYTGATITQRAIVRATSKLLEYVKSHSEQLFTVNSTEHE